MRTKPWVHLLVSLGLLAGVAGWVLPPQGACQVVVPGYSVPSPTQPAGLSGAGPFVQQFTLPDPSSAPTKTPHPPPTWTPNTVMQTAASPSLTPSVPPSSAVFLPIIYCGEGGFAPTRMPTTPPTDMPLPTGSPQPTATPSPCGEVIQNGDFEQGQTIWIEESAGGYDIIGDAWADPYQGSWVAWFGGCNHAGDLLTQQFYVPSNAQDSQTLTFYLYVETEELYETWDFFVLRFLDAAGNPIPGDVPIADNRSAPLPWTLQTINLTGFSAYRGQDMTIQFEGTTDSSQITNFVIDEVSLVFACEKGPVRPALPATIGPR